MTHIKCRVQGVVQYTGCSNYHTFGKEFNPWGMGVSNLMVGDKRPGWHQRCREGEAAISMVVKIPVAFGEVRHREESEILRVDSPEYKLHPGVEDRVHDAVGYLGDYFDSIEFTNWKMHHVNRKPALATMLERGLEDLLMDFEEIAILDYYEVDPMDAPDNAYDLVKQYGELVKQYGEKGQGWRESTERERMQAVLDASQQLTDAIEAYRKWAKA